MKLFITALIFCLFSFGFATNHIHYHFDQGMIPQFTKKQHLVSCSNARPCSGGKMCIGGICLSNRAGYKSPAEREAINTYTSLEDQVKGRYNYGPYYSGY